jgi:hypothetical protein
LAAAVVAAKLKIRPYQLLLVQSLQSLLVPVVQERITMQIQQL